MLRYDQDAMNQKLLDYKSQFSRISLVVKLLSLLQYSVYALLGLFLFTVAVIIYTVIGNSIFFHKEEIEIISLVGGQSGFIYGPFLLQGVFYSLSATLLVSGILLFIRSLISIKFVSGPLMSIQQKVFTELPGIILIEL